MYERFTDVAREAVSLVAAEARHLNHEYIGTEHLLLGLVVVGRGTAAAVLKHAHVSLDEIQRRVEALVQPGPTPVKKGRRFFGLLPPIDKLPQTPRAKIVIEYSMEAVRALHHNYVGSEHLLLGMLREGEGVAAAVLTGLGLELDATRQLVID